MPIIKILFSFQGRISRSAFWLTWLGLMAVNELVATLIIGAAGGEEGAAIMLSLLWMPICIWTALAVQIKRWHDRGKPGWMVLINIIPVVGILWSLVELGFLQGTTGANQYGDNPLQSTQE